MPYLKHFTNDQADELRKEITIYVDNATRPARIRFWLGLAGFIAAMTMGAVAYSSTQDSISKNLKLEIHQTCISTRTLDTLQILQPLGVTFAQYREDPAAVLNIYRTELEGNGYFHTHPSALQAAVQSKGALLLRADPEGCP